MMAPVIALAGNPNVGKSTIFNALTGLRQHTGNWPGKTVSSAQGHYTHGGRHYALVDLPGSYSLLAQSAEEQITFSYLQSGAADVVVICCDATCLERNLILALQIIDMAPRVVVCLNLMDEARKKGIHIDIRLLANLLNVPVVPLSAARNMGLSALRETVAQIAAAPCVSVETIALPSHFPDEDMTSVIGYIRRAEALALRCVKQVGRNNGAERRCDRLLTNRLTGIPIMLCLLLLVLWLTISASNPPSRLLSTGMEWIQQQLLTLFSTLNAPDWLCGALVMGVFRVAGWVIAVMLPPMAIFFPLFTLLEDVGYLPRVAFNLDHAFQRCRACGKQALTMCMGFGCNAVGVTGCRIIDSPRERLIAILTNSFVPCNGRFPALILVSSLFLLSGIAPAWGGLASAALLACLIVVGILMTFVMSRLLSATLLKGIPSSFTLELPPYRRPQIGKVVVRSMLDRTLFVLGRALMVAAPAGLVIWLLANLTVGGQTLLSVCTGFLDPFARMLGLDGVILMAFILGSPANEIVLPIAFMTYLSQGTLSALGDTASLHALLVGSGWTWLTAVCFVVFSLMHWPCATTCLTIKKETGSLKWSVVAIAAPTFAGMLLCFLLASAARLLHLA